jgi:hypothetical protein
MGNSQLDNLEIHLGTCGRVNELLRAEADSINHEHVNVRTIEHQEEEQPNGMTPIAGSYIVFNGEIVAEGCTQALEWLKSYHMRRAKSLLELGHDQQAVALAAT